VLIKLASKNKPTVSPGPVFVKALEESEVEGAAAGLACCVLVCVEEELEVLVEGSGDTFLLLLGLGFFDIVVVL
jgi:hypothetical protein